jgi:uncharacterized protein YjiS (DUF1127 family)
MESSRRSDDSFRPRSASRDGAGLRAVPSHAGRKTATASGNYGRAEALGLFWGTRFWHWCARCSARSRQRRALAQLGDNALKDIGVTRRQANAEAAKPFWK